MEQTFEKIVYDTQEQKWWKKGENGYEWVTLDTEADIIGSQQEFDDLINELGDPERFIGQNPPPR